MNENQFLTIALASAPTMLTVLIGILINNARLNDMNTRLIEMRTDFNTRLSEMRAEMVTKIELRRMEEIIDARLKHLEER